MTVEDGLKVDILDDLGESLKRTNAIVVKLILQHEHKEAKKFAKAAKKLSRRIDKAMNELIDEWAEQSSTINQEIQALNDKLIVAKDALEKNVDNSKQIVEAVGYIDDLTFIAKRLLKP